ncbi:VOC family protein [Cohnella thailandensis]|uniref:VOC family protein n=1 Tax=Cohnella thailandensis TaxID=557557 RepID=A0A841SMN9_9BACL|nr:VOC family protein [Cohnella thailandensis]MBB6633204.1 VOC family protein [Cohnella thailandensis]MBP1975099.1 catechol 2,3-dioxygenase-like lactoylglutathione lyase family enzyme [Cohnella thailandensis]
MEKIVAFVSAIFIPVTDITRSAEWYVRMFDLETIEKTDYRVGLAFPNGQTLVILWKVEKPQPVQFDTGKHPIPYFNFTSYDIDHSYRQLKAKGAELSEIHEEDGHRFFQAFDLDGNPVDIVEETGQTPYFAHKNKIRKQQ